MYMYIYKYIYIYNRRGALLIAGDESCIPATNIRLLGVQVDGNDETVETQYFREDKNQDHTDKQAGLLSGTSHTCITNNTNGKSSS